MPNLEVILVSPLRRTLQTAYNLFKEHPNFKNIKVVLEPNLREQLNSSCDVPGDINAIIYDFSTLFSQVDSSRL